MEVLQCVDVLTAKMEGESSCCVGNMVAVAGGEFAASISAANTVTYYAVLAYTSLHEVFNSSPLSIGLEEMRGGQGA